MLERLSVSTNRYQRCRLHNRSPIAMNGTMGLPVTVWGAGTVSGAAAASLSAWEMVEARWA
jgi:hypothetical protein